MGDQQTVVFSTTPLDSVTHRCRQSPLHRETNPTESPSDYGWAESDPSVKKGVIIEKRDMMLKHDQPKLTNKRKHKNSLANQMNSSTDQNELPCPAESHPSPLRVMRVVTAVLPSSLVARRVSVEDPPPELTTLLPEQISQVLRPDHSRRTPCKPRRLLSESPKQNKNDRQAEVSEEIPAQKHEERSKKSESEDPAEVELTALCGVNQGCDATINHDQRGAKLRRVERIRERVLRSAVRGAGLETVRRLELNQTNEMVDGSREDSVVQAPVDLHTNAGCNQGYQDAFYDNRRVILRPPGEVCRKDLNEKPLPFKAQLSDTVRTEPSSTSHISTLTVINEMESQDISNVQAFQSQNLVKRNSNSSVSSSQRAEWFLSTSQWQEFIPLSIKDDELSLSPTDNQHLDQFTNHIFCSKKQNVSPSVSGGQLLGHSIGIKGEQNSPYSAEDFRNTVASQQSDRESIQPIATSSDNQMTCPSHQSGMDLCIYEEIQYTDNALKSTREAHGNVQSNQKYQDGEQAVSARPPSTLHTGVSERGTSTEDEKRQSAVETGNDVSASTKAGQPVYSHVLKKSVSNQNSTFLKPRVTVLSTSL